jgi:hypothetical protein
MTAHIGTTQNQFERKIRDRLFNLARRPDAQAATSERASKSATASQQPASETSAS